MANSIRPGQQILINYHSSGNTLPNAEKVAKGEIVVLHSNDDPRLAIKKNDGSFAEIRPFDENVLSGYVKESDYKVFSGSVLSALTDVQSAVSIHTQILSGIVSTVTGWVSTNYWNKTDRVNSAVTSYSANVASNAVMLGGLSASSYEKRLVVYVKSNGVYIDQKQQVIGTAVYGEDTGKQISASDINAYIASGYSVSWVIENDKTFENLYIPATSYNDKYSFGTVTVSDDGSTRTKVAVKQAGYDVLAYYYTEPASEVLSARVATWAVGAGSAKTAGTADVATWATGAGSAATADWATGAGSAATATWATGAGSAATATWATGAGSAATATWATGAGSAATATWATGAGSAATATWATGAGSAATATNASQLGGIAASGYSHIDHTHYSLTLSGYTAIMQEKSGTIAYTSDIDAALAGGVNYKGAVTTLPTPEKTGDMYIAAAEMTISADKSGTGKQQKVEIGDFLIVRSGTSLTFDVIEKNNDGAVTTTATTLTDGYIIVGSGNKTIKAVTNSNIWVGGAGSAATADWATGAGSAATATWATGAGSAATATWATGAGSAATADWATGAGSAATATWATGAGSAATATNASQLGGIAASGYALANAYLPLSGGSMSGEILMNGNKIRFDAAGNVFIGEDKNALRLVSTTINLEGSVVADSGITASVEANRASNKYFATDGTIQTISDAYITSATSTSSVTLTVTDGVLKADVDVIDGGEF